MPTVVKIRCVKTISCEFNRKISNKGIIELLINIERVLWKALDVAYILKYLEFYAMPQHKR